MRLFSPPPREIFAHPQGGGRRHTPPPPVHATVYIGTNFTIWWFSVSVFDISVGRRHVRRAPVRYYWRQGHVQRRHVRLLTQRWARGFLGLANTNTTGTTIPPNDRVVMLSASAIRACLVTESGRVATWLDETVSHICGMLEHTATLFTELGGDRWGIRINKLNLFKCSNNTQFDSSICT